MSVRKSAGRVSTILLSLAGLAAILGTITASRAQDTESAIDPILERQLVMQQLEENANGLGHVLAGLEPPEMLQHYTSAIAQDARNVRDSFQTRTPGGATRPEAWSNWEDFSRRLDAFVEKTAEMDQLGQSGNISGVNEIAVDALPCQQCHTLYRTEPAH